MDFEVKVAQELGNSRVVVTCSCDLRGKLRLVMKCFRCWMCLQGMS